MGALKQLLCSQSEVGSLHQPSMTEVEVLFQPPLMAQSDDHFVHETPTVSI